MDPPGEVDYSMTLSKTEIESCTNGTVRNVPEMVEDGQSSPDRRTRAPPWHVGYKEALEYAAMVTRRIADSIPHMMCPNSPPDRLCLTSGRGRRRCGAEVACFQPERGEIESLELGQRH